MPKAGFIHHSLFMVYGQPPIGSVTFIPSGTNYTFGFQVPRKVTRISIVCIGAGEAWNYSTFWPVSTSGAIPPRGDYKNVTDFNPDVSVLGGGNAVGSQYNHYFFTAAPNGGGLSYANDIAVTPYESLTVTVGQNTRTRNDASFNIPLTTSKVSRGSTVLCAATGGADCNLSPTSGVAGIRKANRNSIDGVGDVKINGGTGGQHCLRASFSTSATQGEDASLADLYVAGSGGAAGYTTPGGDGAWYDGTGQGVTAANSYQATINTNGGGDGGNIAVGSASGLQTNGPAYYVYLRNNSSNPSYVSGSGNIYLNGNSGGNATPFGIGSSATKVCGGGAITNSSDFYQGDNFFPSSINGSIGIVRIVWGLNRSFPSTRVSELYEDQVV